MLTHIFINVPPSTDEAGLLACYGSLLTAQGIQNHLGSTPGNFSHPVEESRILIMQEFQENFGYIEGMAAQHDKIELVSVKSNSRHITMTFDVS